MKTAAILIYLLLLPLLGCTLLASDKSVLLMIPAVPHRLSNLHLLDSVLISPGMAIDVEPGDGVIVRVPKQEVVPFAVILRFREIPEIEVVSGGFSAGVDGVVTFRWDEGILARFLVRVAESYGLEWFNLQRLREAVREITPPGALDIEALEAAFAYYALDRTAIRTLPLVEISLPIQGIWLSIDPAEFRVFRSQNAVLAQFSRGYHGLVRADGQSTLFLYVGRDEWVLTINGDPASVRSGSW